MKKLITISTLAALLSVGIATNASAFPHRGYVAPARAYAPPADGYVHHDVWGHWGNYYGPMIHAP